MDGGICVNEWLIRERYLALKWQPATLTSIDKCEYVLAPGQNIEQQEDARMILAHVITRHMRAVVQSYAQKLALAGTN